MNCITQICTVDFPNKVLQSCVPSIMKELCFENIKAESIYANSFIKSRNFLLNVHDINNPKPDNMDKNNYAFDLLIKYIDDVCNDIFSKCNKNDIGMIIIVSNTILKAPGIGDYIINNYLNSDVELLNIIQMGCAAGVVAIRAGERFVNSTPDKIAMIIGFEISSLYANLKSTDLGEIIVNSLFGDGCIGCLIQHFDNENDVPFNSFVLKKSHTYLIPNSSDGIILQNKSAGFSIKLSKDLPKYIESHFKHYMSKLLSINGLHQEDITIWNAHPGGTAIINAVQNSIGLTNNDVITSLDILENYGNMASVAIFYIFKQISIKAEQCYFNNNYGNGVVFSFSPGVKCEGLAFYHNVKLKT